LTCEYLREFSKKFEMIITLFSGARGKRNHEKNLKHKTSLHCPFNDFRWRPQFAKSRPLPAPVLRVCPPPTGGGEEEGEEYDALTPLPLIPGLKRVGSLPLVPSAPEQRREVSLPDLSQYRYSLPDLSQYRYSLPDLSQ
jgi:hypothetical protein